jgi:hypothetical protein
LCKLKSSMLWGRRIYFIIPINFKVLNMVIFM